MAVTAGITSFEGSAGTLVDYLKQEQKFDSANRFEGYYSIARDGVVFQNIGGKATAHLPGLDLSRGLTRAQHHDLHHGKWGDEVLVRGGHRAVWLRDDQGNIVTEKNPKTGRWCKVPQMVDVLDKNGEPVFDKDGNPKQKKLMEPAFISGHMITFSVGKDISEHLIAHPEDTELIKKCLLKAIDKSMTIAVENHCKVVAKTVKKPSEVKRTTKTQGSSTELVKADGLIWFTEVQMAARPTEKSVKRGYGADPHMHGHTMLSTCARIGDKWQKVEDSEIWRSMTFLSDVCSVELNRLVEEHGIHIDYADPDRKGHIHSELVGSNKEVREYFSTQSQRQRELQREFEVEHDGPPTSIEMRAIKEASKWRKNGAAKEADLYGNVDQLARWGEAAKAAGLEISMPGRGDPVKRLSLDERMDTLYQRLEAPNGVAKDVDSVALFGPDVIMPAVYRAAEGLGFTTDQLDLIADTYRETRLIRLDRGLENAVELYTTQTIRDCEADTARLFAEKADQRVTAVVDKTVDRAIRSQRVSLDGEQELAVRAICGDEAVVHINGPAGSGKTQSLKPAVEALRAARLVDQVVVVSIARKRANETGEILGADKSWSVEALRHHAEKGWKANARTLVILDEASMASTFDIADILRLTGKACFVSIGDNKQGQAIGPAGWYDAELRSRQPVTLKHIYRHEDWRDRRDFELIREGDGHQAIRNLDDRGRVFATNDLRGLVQLTQSRWEHYRENGYSPEQIAIVNTGHNSTADAFNRMVQRVRLQAGEISEFATFDVTEQSTGRWWRLHKGDRVIMNKGLYSGLSEPITNGSMGTIVELQLDGRCRIEFDGPERRTIWTQLESEAIQQPVAPAYCISTSKWQGGEVQVVLAIPGNPGIATLNSAYAELTRATKIAELLADRSVWGENHLVTLGDALSRETHKELVGPYIDMIAQEKQAWEEAAERDLGQLTEREDALARVRELKADLGLDRGMHL